MAILREQYDSLLVDLDGTAYTGDEVIPYAIDALRDGEPPVLFTTNNASRSAEEVSQRLQKMGFSAHVDQVVTSGQAATVLLAEQIPPGSSVYVLGTEALRELVRQQGFTVVDSADDNPAAVIQGHNPGNTWYTLCEAVLAIRAGALWLASNADATLPDERGMLPGNGAMVAAVATATDSYPQVVGKPEAPIFTQAMDRISATRPLVVGDRLNTDIEGAASIYADSLHVLTGVSRALDLLNATPNQRPTYIAADLRALDSDAAQSRVPTVQESQASEDFSFTIDGTRLIVSSQSNREVRGEEALIVLRELLPQVWSVQDGATNVDFHRSDVSSESTAQPAAKSLAQPAAKSVAQPAAKSVAQPAAKSVAQPGTRTAASFTGIVAVDELSRHLITDWGYTVD